MTGAAGQRAPAGDLAVTDALRNRLFASPDDLVARNLQRGRDHGIPSYSDLRVACGMEPLSLDKPAEINQQRWTDLLDVYNVPSDIDAFTGGLSETAPSDGIVGPLFACIISNQFERLRDGDRYFFTHQEDAASSARPLKPLARENILRRSLAAVMCDNIPTLTEMQGSVFRLQGQDNPTQPCADFPQLDFEGIVREALAEVFGITAAATAATTAATTTTFPNPTTTTTAADPGKVVNKAKTISAKLLEYNFKRKKTPVKLRVYSSLFQPIPAYSSLFQHIPDYSSLFKPIPAYS